MRRHVIHLDNGEVVEFTGELVAETQAETPKDPRTVAVDALSVYRTDEGRFVLVMERSLKVRSKTFCLNFNSVDDVEDYLGRDESLRPAARELGRTARSRQEDDGDAGQRGGDDGA